MLRPRCPRSLSIVLRRRGDTRPFSSSPVTSSHQPNAPLDLDPSFQALLKDVDISLLRQKSRHATAPVAHSRAHRELEVYPHNPSIDDYSGPEQLDSYDSDPDTREGRKSPAALFGSQGIGAVVLPAELQQTITRLIADSDKHALHMDATRLFQTETDDESEWNSTFDVKYKSRRQADRHAQRDGTAFASVALPSHYSAIVAVLDHVKRRLGPDWHIAHIIDWGSGTGSGLWAASHSFQQKSNGDVMDDLDDAQLSATTVATYLGIERREGLAAIGKRLVRDMNTGDLDVSWQKSFQDSDRIERSKADSALAISAFMLSSLSTPLARKNLVKEMWESGAGVMVLIDHNTTTGFECIAEAREYILRLGRKELDNPETEDWDHRGSHVVAPCPHDGACPLYQPGSSKLVCGFSQRLQRPAFVRKTKHSGVGHEDSGYSYVVIRRGSRPSRALTKVGRVGEVGKRETLKLAMKQTPSRELVADEGQVAKDSMAAVETDVTDVSSPDVLESSVAIPDEPRGHDVEAALRLEAYAWPRLVFPPLKRNGHVIIDGCTAEGKIMRMTIPRSQGKQSYYDARKSGWGDIFPHEPKNAPQERSLPTRVKQKDGVTLEGQDIGKRRKAAPQAVSYNKLSNQLGDQKRRRRLELGKDWVE